MGSNPIARSNPHQDCVSSHQHQTYGTLKTFLRWCIETGALRSDQLRGFSMRTPKTLPQVPTEEELRAVLAVCPETMDGVRNQAMVLVLADSSLRAGEVLRVLVEDWRAADRSLFVRAGEGRTDRVAFVGPTATRTLEAWLARHPVPSPESLLFCDRADRPLKHRHLVQILHRFSRKADLPAHRRLHPHALRLFAATSRLRGGAGLDEVRRLLGHGSLSTTLRYGSLVGADLRRAHKKAGAIERMPLS